MAFQLKEDAEQIADFFSHHVSSMNITSALRQMLGVRCACDLSQCGHTHHDKIIEPITIHVQSLASLILNLDLIGAQLGELLGCELAQLPSLVASHGAAETEDDPCPELFNAMALKQALDLRGDLEPVLPALLAHISLCVPLNALSCNRCAESATVTVAACLWSSEHRQDGSGNLQGLSKVCLSNFDSSLPINLRHVCHCGCRSRLAHPKRPVQRRRRHSRWPRHGGCGLSGQTKR